MRVLLQVARFSRQWPACAYLKLLKALYERAFWFLMCDRANWHSSAYFCSLLFVKCSKLLLSSSCSNLFILNSFKLPFSVELASDFADRVLLRIVNTLVSDKLLNLFNGFRFRIHDSLFFVKAVTSSISLKVADVSLAGVWPRNIRRFLVRRALISYRRKVCRFELGMYPLLPIGRDWLFWVKSWLTFRVEFKKLIFGAAC